MRSRHREFNSRLRNRSITTQDRSIIKKPPINSGALGLVKTFVALNELAHFSLTRRAKIDVRDVIDAIPISHVPEEQVQFVLLEVVFILDLLHIAPFDRRVLDVERSHVRFGSGHAVLLSRLAISMDDDEELYTSPRSAKLTVAFPATMM